MMRALLIFLGFSFGVYGQQPDYTDMFNWAYHPDKITGVLNEYIEDSTWIEQADVFYLYPTFFMDKSDSSWNISIEDEKQREIVADKAVRYQASAWAESGRVFAPFYRQAHLRSYRNLENGGKEALLFAYGDVRAAFQHYLQHYNNGRPIILAGHSQGSTHIMLLLKEFFDGQPLQKQLVAAYMPGISVEKDYYKTIKHMTCPNETGGFVVWNTFKKKISEEKYEMWYKGSYVVNPVTWDESEVAPRKKHQGFLFWNNKMYCHRFKTTMIDGAVWITTPRFPYFFISLKMDDYHLGDVNLFWKDIRENSKFRLESWSKTQY